MSASRTILLLLAVATVLMAQHYFPRMPDPMASHFDGSGRPDGYQSRDAFFLLTGGILASVVVLFAGAGLLFRVLPTSLFNLPHRDYWLAPERRDETIAFMTRQMEWFGVGTLLPLFGVLWMAVEANLMPDPRLDSETMWWALGVYLIFTVIWLVRFVLKFRTSPR